MIKIQIYLLTRKDTKVCYNNNTHMQCLVEGSKQHQVPGAAISLIFQRGKWGAEQWRPLPTVTGKVQSWESDSRLSQSLGATHHHKSLRTPSPRISKAHEEPQCVMNSVKLCFFPVYKTEWLPLTTPGNTGGDIPKYRASAPSDLPHINTGKSWRSRILSPVPASPSALLRQVSLRRCVLFLAPTLVCYYISIEYGAKLF